MTPTVSVLGDSAIRIVWPGLSDDAVFAQIRRAVRRLKHEGFLQGQLVPGFASLTVMLDRLVDDWNQEVVGIETVLAQDFDSSVDSPSKTVRIPVCFDLEFAPDLPQLVELSQLSQTDLIGQFVAITFQVRLIGFAPGFPYLAGLPQKFAMPRRSTPRLKVPAGSVAIGGQQTGIYPQASPGGWNLIGQTPAVLFDPSRNSPCLLSPGDEVQFFAITREAFEAQRFDA